MGLGSFPAVSLADARKERDRWRYELQQGRDPIDTRRAAQEAEAADRDREDPTFRELVLMVFEAKKARLRGEGVRGRWLSPFEIHLFPSIGRRRGSELTAQHYVDALRPIWKTKHPTAEKAFQRARLVLREAQFLGLPVDPIEIERAARMLGEVVHKVAPITATPWQEIPELFDRLPDTNAGQCLRFMVLTLVRLDGCTGARWQEFAPGVWTVPEDRVKGQEGRVSDFRVPLSGKAEALVHEQLAYFDDVLFPGTKGAPISSRALEKCLDGIGEAGRPHGFRTSFRTWVQDTNACDREVAEMVLGHKVYQSVEGSYARSDMLDRRRIVMKKWAAHVTAESAEVVKLRG